MDKKDKRRTEDPLGWLDLSVLDPQKLGRTNEVKRTSLCQANLSKSETYQDCTCYIRPSWPHQTWSRSVANEWCGGGSSLNTENKAPKRSTSLQTFFQTISSHVLSAHHPEADAVREEVEKMMEKLVEGLSMYRMFQNCNLCKMGSVYEGTKVGDPNEFDFMIELSPLVELGVVSFDDISTSSLSEKLCKLLSGKRGYDEDMHFKILQPDFFEDILCGEEPFIESSLWLCVLRKVINLLEKNILPGWTLMKSYVGLDSLTMTQFMLRKGRGDCSWLLVHIDICIAVPLSFDMQASMPELKGVPVLQEAVSVGRQCMILRSSGEARLCRCHCEMAVWRSIADDDGRKNVYRAGKYIISTYMPGKYNVLSCSTESQVPSYWIKTVMFYMFLHYPDDQSWRPELAAVRLVEVFRHLEVCLISQQLSAFFVPHNVLMNKNDKRETLYKFRRICTCLYDLMNGRSEVGDVLAELEENSKTEDE